MDDWLSHLTILDLGQGIAGPFCGRLLGQLGAEVIKIEPPGMGDPARAYPPFFQDIPHPEGSGLFSYLNGGKKSVTLNIYTSSGARLLKELVKGSDVLIETFEPGAMADRGLSYDDLATINPDLVMTSITNFGQNGPYRYFKANELIHFALSGLMYPTGFPEREPIQSGGLLPQHKSGLVAAIGTLAALRWRGISGSGQHLDVSVLEVAANFLETTPILYTYQNIVVRVDDVVMENFSARVMGNLGLGYEAIKSVKPDVIMISLPGFGTKCVRRDSGHGPGRDRRAYGGGRDLECSSCPS